MQTLELRKGSGRARDAKHLDFIRSLPCVRCLDNTATEAAHYRASDARIGKKNPGVGQKPDDRFVLPLCSAHHRQQHEIGETNFWQGMEPVLWSLAIYSVSGDAEAAEKIINAAFWFQREVLEDTIR